MTADQAGTAHDALERLRAGNLRYLASDRGSEARTGPRRRCELLDGQAPFAVILCCSDSRAPAEVIFGQGLGDLFVVRVAGNIVASSLVGSIEMAAQTFGTRLVVVMGHTGCGAIQATLDDISSPNPAVSPHLREIFDQVRPAVEPLLGRDDCADRAALEAEAVRANVRASKARLRQESALLRELEDGDGLRIVGAQYQLATGVVEFFDELPPSD